MPAPFIMALAPKILDVLGDVFESAFPNSAEREQKRLEYALKLQETMNQLDMAQLEVNKVEAQSASMFVAGWRPAIGWVCAGAFAWTLILRDFLIFAMTVSGTTVPTLPAVDGDLLGWAMGGMLGLGTMRTVEKVKGVTMGMASPKLPWTKNDS